MKTKLAHTSVITDGDGYEALEYGVRKIIGDIHRPIFTTNADPDNLWKAYLLNIPKDRRSYYTCHCCRKFIQHFGGLVTIDDADGLQQSVLWTNELQQSAPFFLDSVKAMAALVNKAKVTGVFLTSKKEWGNAQTKEWTHLSGTYENTHKGAVKTDSQAAAEKLEDYKILIQGLVDYPKQVAELAVQVLKADAVERAEKALGIGVWFAGLHEQLQGKKGRDYNNIVWSAVAMAPPGFCHIRSTMISTLLDDLVMGTPMPIVKEKWSKKMHPLQYQRPQAPPSSGTIEQAEKLVEKLGLARSLERRYAKLDEVVTLWRPSLVKETPATGKGVFDHLKTPPKTMLEVEAGSKLTWAKFSREVLPTAREIEIFLPYTGPYSGLVTAAHADAPPILQWDTEEQRNPVSWYFYVPQSYASGWGLTASTWGKVNAVFFAPHMWHSDRYTNQAKGVHFAVEGCKDQNGAGLGLALFPETLKNEMHAVRSVIEAFSKRGTLAGVEEGDANGLAYRASNTNWEAKVRVTTGDVKTIYILDRWD